MIVHLLRLLGVTPASAGKTGKREAAWMLVGIALGLTVGAMADGEGMVTAMTAILMVLWPAAIAALAGAYKLEVDRLRREAAEPVPPALREPPPPDWPAGGIVGGGE